MTSAGTLPDRDTLRRALLVKAGHALQVSDAAQARAIDAMQRGDTAACRFELARRDLWARRAGAHLAEFKKLETLPTG